MEKVEGSWVQYVHRGWVERGIRSREIMRFENNNNNNNKNKIKK